MSVSVHSETAPAIPDRPWLTPAEAAALLGVSYPTVLAACRAGRLPAIRLGRRFRIPRRALSAFLPDGGGA